MKLAKLGGKLLLGLALSACGGSAPPPKNQDDPPPPLDGEDVAPASNAKVQEGIKAIQAEDFAKAKAVLTEARGSAPQDPQAAFYLGVAHEGLGEFDAAKKHYAEALSLDEKLTEASVNLSALLLEGKDPEGALAVVDAALKHAGKDARLLMNRALAFEASGKAAEAVSAYGAAVAAAPDKLELRYAYAELLAQAGQRDQAVAQLARVKEASDVRLLAAAGNLFGKLKAFPECVAALDKAIAVKAAPGLHVRRGVCRHELKDDAGAKKDYDAAVALDAKFAPAHYYLGQHLKAAGKKKEAKAAFKKAAELGGDKGVGAAAKKALEQLK